MHKASQQKRAAPQKAASKPTTKKTVSKKTVSKKTAHKKTKRSFGTTAPTSDPRFSTINADVDRKFQTAAMPVARLAKFSNGLRVTTQDAPESGLTTIALTIEAGSRNEDDSNNGVAKMLSGAFAHGTAKLNQEQFAGAFEDMGGSFKTKVGRERTVLSATVQNKHAKDALKLLAEVFQKPKITSEVVENLRSKALTDLGNAESDVALQVMNRFHQTAYRYTPLSLSPEGHVHTVSKMTTEQVQQFHNTHYTAPTTVLSIVGGGLNHDDLADAANSAFAHLPKAPTNGIHPKKAPSNFTGSELRVRDDDMPQVHAVFGFETAGYNDEDNFALQALGHVIGTHDKFQSVTEKYSSSEYVSALATYGVAHSSNIVLESYADSGIFGVHVTAAPNTLDKLGEVLMRGLVLPTTMVPEQSIVEAKSKMKADLLGNHGTEAQAETIGKQYLQFNRVLHPSETLARIDAIDQMAVQNVAKRFILDQDFAVAAIGNTFELQDYVYLRKKTSVAWM